MANIFKMKNKVNFFVFNLVFFLMAMILTFTLPVKMRVLPAVTYFISFELYKFFGKKCPLKIIAEFPVSKWWRIAQLLYKNNFRIAIITYSLYVSFFIYLIVVAIRFNFG
jgi:hypothetical protein